MENNEFNSFSLSSEMLRAIEDMGFETATPIQAKTISLCLEGYDVIGQSQTGTGKTAAFGIPCLENVEPNGNLQTLVICPTRELAMQVSEEFRKLLKYKEGIKVLAVYGGQPIQRQIMSLRKGVQVIVGTPGRIMDHMNRKTIRLKDIKHVILDEADEMLDMGFREDIEMILEKVKSDHQTILFSATMPKPILDITKNYQTDPKYVRVAKKELTVENIKQVYIEVKERNKLEALCRLIDVDSPDLAIVFCNTKKRVDEVVERLQARGYFAEGLHGDLKQMQRDFVMKKFRNRTLQVLVATDVAARGIDVDDVDVVFNFDLPQDDEYYVHRIGRTGRAGKKGKAYSFVVGREMYKLKDIMAYTKAEIQKEKPPTIEQMEKIKADNFYLDVQDTIENGHLTKYTEIITSWSEHNELETLCSALLKLHLHNDSVEDIDLNITDKVKGQGKSKSKGSSRVLENSSRMFISVGRRDKVSPKDIVGTIANEAGISSKNIGAIDIYNEFTFVDISNEYVKSVLKKVNGKKIKGKKIKIEKAKRSK